MSGMPTMSSNCFVNCSLVPSVVQPLALPYEKTLTILFLVHFPTVHIGIWSLGPHQVCPIMSSNYFINGSLVPSVVNPDLLPHQKLAPSVTHPFPNRLLSYLGSGTPSGMYIMTSKHFFIRLTCSFCSKPSSHPRSQCHTIQCSSICQLFTWSFWVWNSFR